MTGKSALLLVIGFITIYAFIGFKLNTVSYSAVDNMADYFEETVALNFDSREVCNWLKISSEADCLIQER